MSDVVDANIFLRLLTRDDPEQSDRCLDLFRRAARGEERLVTSDAVVAEVVYVLASPVLYGRPRSDIAIRLGAVLVNNGLRLNQKDAVLEALDLYGRTNLHFVDCLCIAHAKRLDGGRVYSYDRGFDRVTEVTRVEP